MIIFLHKIKNSSSAKRAAASLSPFVFEVVLMMWSLENIQGQAFDRAEEILFDQTRCCNETKHRCIQSLRLFIDKYIRLLTSHFVRSKKKEKKFALTKVREFFFTSIEIVLKESSCSRSKTSDRTSWTTTERRRNTPTHIIQYKGEDLFQDEKILFLKMKKERNIKKSSSRPTVAFRWRKKYLTPMNDRQDWLLRERERERD